MYTGNKIWVAQNESDKSQLCILPQMANRHGMIAGATGTGKTITLKVLAESFSDCGVPVFLADVKGDLAGMCKPGEDSTDMQERIRKFSLAENGFSYHAYPTCFWDIFGEKGLPLRTTISEMGPLLLSRLLDLNQTQSDILNIVFRIADDQGLLLIDMKDLRAMLQYVGDNAADYVTQYGNIAKQSVGAIMRSLVSLDEQGADKFFGEPALDIHDWFKTDENSRGMINILHSESLINNPSTYSVFMLWMLSELFETLPEAGDVAKPKMVFFFDEAHLLFDSAPKALLQKIEQVVKLIRSKGVGIYFITQNPKDIPDGVLAQLGNKIQHALHAYTPAEQKGVKAAAQSFRTNPEFDTEEAIMQLGTGEALVSFLMEDGSPSVVSRCFILPPQSRMGTITDDERKSQIESNPLSVRYADMIDRDSAYEFLQRKSQQNEENQANELAQKENEKSLAKKAAADAKAAAAEKKQGKRAVKSVASTAAGTVGREIGNTIGKTVGGSFGKRIGGNVGASIGRGLLSTIFKL